MMFYPHTCPMSLNSMAFIIKRIFDRMVMVLVTADKKLVPSRKEIIGRKYYIVHKADGFPPPFQNGAVITPGKPETD